MKKAFTIRLCIVVTISMLAIVLLSYYLQMKSAKEALYANSTIWIEQISQLLEQNDLDIEHLKEDLKEDYFIRAKAAAYIIQNNPEVKGNLEEIRKIASLLQVDELHLFDKEGHLFDGSEPKYYDFTFNSGEQMQFFLPMLDDNTLSLCQDVVPNTAEQKLMQYLAVWREDKQEIIQIGMEPVRLLEAMEKTDLRHIFSIMSVDKNTTIFVMERQTGSILGSTNNSLTGKHAVDIGIDLDHLSNSSDTLINTEIEKAKNYCVISPSGELFIGVSSTYESMYQSIQYSMILVSISLFLLSVIIILLILNMLDKFIIHGIEETITGMKAIASGDLDFRVNAEGSPEFIELSNNINNLVMSLLETTGKLSLVFENVKLPIAVYEYNKDMKRVMATRKIGDILIIQEHELHNILSDHTVFEHIIHEIRTHPFLQEEDVYLIGEEDIHYVKIQSYCENNKVLGIVADVTTEIVEKLQLTLERDTDLLTGLYSRRAFYNKMDDLFSQPEKLGVAALLMVDLDNLKYTNDRWGHEAGDKLLKKAAELLNNCSASCKLAARLGGDEFILLIYHAKSQEEIQTYIDELHSKITESEIKLTDDEQTSVCFSGGYVFIPEGVSDYNDMISLADQTMYKVKRSAKGNFLRYVFEQQ